MGNSDSNKEIKILIAEDNQGLNRLIAKKLTDLNYDYQQVYSGEAALEEIEENNYDLLLFDYQLPDMTAKDMVNKMDQSSPFIVMTGNGDERVAVEMMKLGAADYLVKDYNFIELLPEVISHILKEVANQRKLNAAYRQLSENANYYESLFIENPKVLLLFDPETQIIVDANEAALSFYGYSRNELTKKKISEITDTEQAKILKRIEESKIKKENYFEAIHSLANGEKRMVKVYSSLIKVRGQELLYLIITDITAQKQMKRRLHQEEQKYQLLFENTGTATAIVKKGGVISLVNEEFETLTAYSKSELENKMSCRDLIIKTEDFGDLFCSTKNSDLLKQPEKYEFQIKDKEGAVKDVLIKIKVIPETKERILSMLDISRRKEREEELDTAYQKLNQNIEKARKLHQHFLPQPYAKFEQFSIASFYQPADELGGDFYNFEEVNGKLMFYVADVTGHGLDGAMLNLLVREQINNTIAASKFLVAENKELDDFLMPEDIMQAISNNYLKQGFPEDYFLCMQIGVIDLEQQLLQYSNAGFHILPYVISNTASLMTIDNSHLPITNINVADDEFSSVDYQLQPGDKLFITTDGLIEEVNSGERYGRKRLKNVLKEYYYLPANILIEEIKRELKEFADGLNNRDDITFLVIEKDMEERLAREINSDFEEMYQLEDEVVQFLQPYVEDTDFLQMGIHEVITNAIEHGNRLKSKKKVKLEAAICDKYIRISICDQGDGFNCEEILEFNFEEINFAERGRGLMMANQVYDEIKFNNQGNQVCLIKFRK